jgi:zinc/manganese transport system permease protein
MSGSFYSIFLGPFEGFGFMRIALAACLAMALSNGPLGTLLLLRRMSLVADVLSHAVLPGAALGFLYAGYSLTNLSLGGLATGTLVAALSGLVARRLPKRQDASLAAFYLISLAAGVMIVAVRGSNVDLMRVLFGTVLAVDTKGLLLIAAVSSATVLILAAIYRPLAVESFDPAFLRAIGGGAGRLQGLFLLLVVANLVASFQALGTLLAVGIMLLPAAAARCWTQRVWPMMALSIVLGALADYAGLMLSYYANLPSGPAIVLAAGCLYGLSLFATADQARMVPAGR